MRVDAVLVSCADRTGMMLEILRRRVVIFLVALLTRAATSEDATIITWKVESGDADQAVITEQLGRLSRVNAYYCKRSTRVTSADTPPRSKAHGGRYRHYLSWLGGWDRCAW